MGLLALTRRILGTGRFPRMQGQELPDPVDKGRNRPLRHDQSRRDESLGRKPTPVKPKP